MCPERRWKSFLLIFNGLQYRALFFSRGNNDTNFSPSLMHNKNIHRIFVVYGIDLTHIQSNTKRLDVLADIESKVFTEEFNFGHNLFQFFSSPQYNSKTMSMVFINEEYAVDEIKTLQMPSRVY